MTEYIYYTGFGANPDGKHTVNEFLKIMNEHFGIECSESLVKKKKNPCVEQRKILAKEIKYNMKHNKPIFEFNRDKKTQKKYDNLLKKCNKFKKTLKNKKCNIDEYVKFSGAEIKK